MTTMTRRHHLLSTGRWLPNAAIACGIGLFALGLASAQPRSPARRFDPPELPSLTPGPLAPDPTRHQIREGTEVVDRLGYFRATGDRMTFFSEDGKDRYVALENLSLERIAQAVADNPTQLQWSITGTVTEYRGSNFILIRRAILKSQAYAQEDSF